LPFKLGSAEIARQTPAGEDIAPSLGGVVAIPQFVAAEFRVRPLNVFCYYDPGINRLQVLQ
jgi:hypothetical protein